MATSNYQDVVDQLRAAGLVFTELQTGRLVRCRVEGDREKRGWYILHELTTNDGGQLLVGSFGVWQGAVNNAQKIEIRKDAFTTEQRDALRRRLAEDRKRVDGVRKAVARRAAEQARKAWAKCSAETATDNEYLVRKGIGAHGVRFSPSGALIVPMLDAAGQIHGLQVIRSSAAAKADKRPAKEFWPTGLAMRGTFHLLGMPTTIGLITEGYATGATLHEATGLPTVVAWAANNLGAVAAALRVRYPRVRWLFCADDDLFARCANKECRARLVLTDHPKTCPACGQDHLASNAGVGCASTAAVQVGGAWCKPRFADEAGRCARWLDKGIKLTDFNDLYFLESKNVVAAQVEARLSELGWFASAAPPRPTSTGGAGAALRASESTDELLERYALIYAMSGAVFDRQEHQVVALSDMRDACRHREIHKAWMQHPDRAIVRASEVDFDPSESDPAITCNLWAGWPTDPKPGVCDKLLDLLRHMCSDDDHPERLFRWVLRWVAYPIQHPGAKMRTTLVLHGPQGTGKNLFFEALMAIYGPYGRIIDQSSIEDKFNDWASRKLFLIADEVVARSDLFHVKNKLKAFITGTWIRINPKNVAARDERNHVNMVFLSNEPMPVALEEDDRRHAVIWTPSGLAPDFYAAVAEEIDAGGVAALHDYLLHLDLGDFHENTKPPYTDAKEELINLGRDSPTRFYNDLLQVEIGTVPFAPALAKDAYGLYKHYCAEIGVRAAPMPKFVNALVRKHQVGHARRRYLDGMTVRGPHGVLFFGQAEPPEGVLETTWLGESIEAFRNAVSDYRGEKSP